MDKKKKKALAMGLAALLVLTAIIGYRIYANLAANKERAARMSQTRSVAVEVGKVSRRDIQPKLTFSANLEPAWTADISPKVDGRIDTLLVNEGDKVQTGSVIATLDTNELYAQVIQAEGTLYTAQAALEQAELDLQRYIPLANQGAISPQSLDAARIKRDSSVGQVRSAEGNLALLRARLDNANVTAPQSGLVTKRYLQSGYYAKAGSPIISLADTASLLAKASIGEAEVSQMSIGLPAIVYINALGNKQFNGTVTRITPAANLPARTFTAEVTIPNGEELLKTGMYAKVEIPGQLHQNVLVVPEGSLVLREDQKTVYVVTAENKVQQRILKLGYVGDGWAEVLEGVQEGEKIVISGQNKLRDGANITTAAGEGDI